MFYHWFIVTGIRGLGKIFVKGLNLVPLPPAIIITSINFNSGDSSL